MLDAMKKYTEAKEVYQKALEVGLEEVGPEGRGTVEEEIKKLIEGIKSAYP